MCQFENSYGTFLFIINPLRSDNRNFEFLKITKEKPHRNIEKKSWIDQFLVHKAMIYYTKVKRLNNFHKNYFSM